MPEVGAEPSLPFPSRKPVPVAGPAHPHYRGPAHDFVAPPPDDRLVCGSFWLMVAIMLEII